MKPSAPAITLAPPKFPWTLSAEAAVRDASGPIDSKENRISHPDHNEENTTSIYPLSNHLPFHPPGHSPPAPYTRSRSGQINRS
jgi:hypothetical protein